MFHLRQRQFRVQAVAGSLPRRRDGGTQLLHGRWLVPIALAEIFDERHQDVELSHRPEMLRHFPETTIEFSRGVAIDLQQREQFAKAPRGDAGAVQCRSLALVHSWQFTREGVESFPKRIAEFSRAAHAKPCIVTNT